MVAAAMAADGGEDRLVTPGEVLGKAADFLPGRGTYLSPHNQTLYASLSGLLRLVPAPPSSPHQKTTVEVTGHKAHGPVPQPGSVVIARVTKVMARMASADILCVGPKAVREKFTGTIRQQDVRATEIDKVEMHLSFRPGVISAESLAGATMVPVSWTEMQCPLTGQVEQRKVAKSG